MKIIPDESMAPSTTKGDTEFRDWSKLPFSRKYLDADTSELDYHVTAEPNLLPPFNLLEKLEIPVDQGRLGIIPHGQSLLTIAVLLRSNFFGDHRSIV